MYAHDNTMVHRNVSSVSFTVPLFDHEPGLWQIIAAITLPIAVVKQFISLLILKVACQSIAAIDSKERENKRIKRYSWLCYLIDEGQQHAVSLRCVLLQTTVCSGSGTPFLMRRISDLLRFTILGTHPQLQVNPSE